MVTTSDPHGTMNPARPETTTNLDVDQRRPWKPLGTAAPKSRGIPLDEARLRPHLRRNQQQTLTSIDMLEPSSAFGAYTIQRVTKSKTFKPEPADLRGIPVVGPGVGGVQPGTNPESAVIAKLSRTAA